MHKAAIIFWVDASLFGLLTLAVLMVVPEIATHAFMHVLPGMLLMVGVVFHLWLHWDWIKTAFQKFGRMPKTAKENALIDLALLGAYLLSGGIGLFSRLMYYISTHQHIHLGVLHVILSVLVLTLQTIHLARHFKWIKKNVQTRILGNLSREI